MLHFRTTTINKAAVDAEIERLDREYCEHRSAAPETAFDRRLKELRAQRNQMKTRDS